MKTIFTKYIAIALSALAVFSAQSVLALESSFEDFGQLGVPTFKYYVIRFVELMNLLVPILISLALIGFLVGVTRYGFSQDSDESKASAKIIMVWGVIILFVMTSIWGILKILTNTFLGA